VADERRSPWQHRIDGDGGTGMTTGVDSVDSSPKTLVASVGQVVRPKPPGQGVRGFAHCQDPEGNPFGRQRDVAAWKAPTTTLACVRSSVPVAGLPLASKPGIGRTTSMPGGKLLRNEEGCRGAERCLRGAPEQVAMARRIRARGTTCFS